MPIIFLRSLPPNSGRFLLFAWMVIVLILVVPFGGGVVIAWFLSPLLGCLWGALSFVILVYLAIRIDRRAAYLLEWQIDQYSKPVWESFDEPPPARTLLDKIAEYITEE